MMDAPDLRSMKFAHALVRPGLVIAGLAALTACTPATEKTPPIPAVFVTPVHNDQGEDVRILSGVVRPRVESDLALRAGGKVTARLVELGQAVRAGQPLVRVDAADYQLAAGAAAEQLRAAQVDATQAASDAARFKRLLLDGSVGVATGLQIEVGQVVSEGQPVMALAKPGELEVLVDVPEALAAGLREKAAQARIADMPDLVKLKLREMAPSASAQPRTFRARYTIASAPAGLRMGVTANVQLAGKNATTSAQLPSGALLTTNKTPSGWG